MRIGLLDIDHHNYPNLAQMKLSAYHKAKGDEVQVYTTFDDRYDIVYMSKVFSFSQDYEPCVNADLVVKGGTGYAIRLVDGHERYCKAVDVDLPDDIEHQYPDYSLYPMYTQDTAYGYLTRGCPRGCTFCHVKDKEGLKSRKVADLSEFWHGQRNIVLNDPNILACKDWEGLFEQLIASKANIDFNQGLDIRMMTEAKIEAINATKVKEIHFAWDKYEDKEAILPKFELYRSRCKFSPHSHNAIVFVLTNYGSTLEQDLERIYTLRDMNYWPYVMVYDKDHAPKVVKHLQRWVNNRVIFAQCKRFEDYEDNPRNRP